MKRIFGALVNLVFSASAVAQNQPVRPPITGIVYVRIVASDLEKARGFYKKKLGFEDVMGDCYSAGVPCIPVNLFQNIELDHQERAPSSGLVTALAFATSSATRLQSYLEAHGVRASGISNKDYPQFEVIDPEDHRVVFIQLPSAGSGKWTQWQVQVSARLIHAGFVVHDRAAEDRFYKNVLGFHVYWHGGMKDGETDWVDMQVPDGTDWIEYMLNVSPSADKKELGVMNHIALGVPDIKVARAQLLKNGMKLTEEPQIGRDGKWQLNLYDPDDTRVEFMEFTPVQKPCCSPYAGPHPKP